MGRNKIPKVFSNQALKDSLNKLKAEGVIQEAYLIKEEDNFENVRTLIVVLEPSAYNNPDLIKLYNYKDCKLTKSDKESYLGMLIRDSIMGISEMHFALEINNKSAHNGKELYQII